MTPEIKKILNGLKCPICKSPIDITYDFGYNYGCALNNDHYRLTIQTYVITKEIVNLYEKKRKYSIVKLHFDKNTRTEIEIYETDLENRVIFSFENKTYISYRDLFDFTAFDADKAISRIKTFLLFQ